MCDAHALLHHPHDGPEFILDTPVVRAFIDDVRAVITRHEGRPVEDALAALEPCFAELMADRTWLPEPFMADAPESGMGSGIGQWALYRAHDGSLCLFSLVVPPGASTPIHDHRAWGLIGLYRGTQDEDVFAHDDGHERVHLKSSNTIARGEFFALIPPDDDIHQITTTSDVKIGRAHV
mgnify:CR=1 FL=1